MADRRRWLGALLLTAGLLLPSGARVEAAAVAKAPPPADAGGDDIFLMSTSVEPNVILLMDNSLSMNQIEWHPAFDPDAGSYGCNDFDNAVMYEYTVTVEETHCGNTRKIYAPIGPGEATRWDGRYLNWYFSDDADAHENEIKTAKANVEGCTQAGGGKFFNNKYRRTRLEASKQVLLDLLCVAEPKNVRFGVANYRDSADAAGEDPTGGFVVEDLGRSNPNHAAELEAAIKNATVNDPDNEATPLSESLFQIYSFWMSRVEADIPLGADGSTRFPRYQYDKFGNWETNDNNWTEDPMLYPCEKAFVIVVTDGVPTRDDFLNPDPTSTAVGFDDFDDLIGDYNNDGETEVPGNADETSWYLDDIAKYMYERDFRPDLADVQTIDTYTVGLATGADADALLSKTADVGNGLFLKAKDGDQLAFALIEALNDIIEKAQSFTAASVPSARTIDGGDFYQSYFFPSGKSAFWEGHIRAWRITAGGDIHDKNDVCALDDPDAGECNSGPFLSSAEYFWDASEEMPQPDSRKLFTSKLVAGAPTMVAFDDTLTAADLTLAAFVNAPPDPTPNSALYPVVGSTALNAEGLADEVIAFGRGCFFGTGVDLASTDVTTPVVCAARPSRLGDIFHSDPLVVRQPRRRPTNVAYKDFKTAYSARTRMIYVGTNAGFVEAVNAGAWDASATPLPKYDAGTGAETFGFMPWESRQTIKQLPIDPPTNRNHYVDGAPQASDVWMYGAATDAAIDVHEWRTVLMGGMREGGRQYYALDITNPDGIVGPAGTPGPGGVLPYPGYLWEFPQEDDPDGDLALMGETWSKPVITKVRVKVGGNDNSGAGYERWVAIVASGYSDLSDPNPDTVTGVSSVYDATATNGRAIFLIDVKTGKVLAEKKFDAAATDGQQSMLFSIVSNPAVFDLNADGFADVIYVGDMGGQVFKWVIHDIGEDRVNDGSGLRTQPAWPFKVFFRAPVTTIGVGAGAKVHFQNFFFPPAATFVSSKLWLAFGSGERRSLAFEGVAAEDENNRFYVVSDPDPFERALAPLGTVTEADLTDISGDEDGASFAARGYYFKVKDGEKFVTNVEIFAGQVIAASFIPTISADPCAARGQGTLYVFDIRDGKGYFEDASANPTRAMAIGVGLPTDPRVSVGVGGYDNRVYVEKSGTDLWSAEQDDIPAGGQFLYWRERY
jgi:type IV pilus assembly protein PilY1